MTVYSDDFNRANSNLEGTTSSDGEFEWEKISLGSHYLKVFNNQVWPGSGTGPRYYRSNKVSAGGNAHGAQVDIPDQTNTDGVGLLLQVANEQNLTYAYWDFSSGDYAIKRRISGTFETLVSGTGLTAPTKPFTFTFYFMAGNYVALEDGVEKFSATSASIENTGATTAYSGLAFFSDFGGGSNNIRYDNFNYGPPWELGIGVSPPDAASDYNPLVAQRDADRSRLDSLLGGRQSTILTSALGLDDAVPTAKIHLIGRC